MRENTTKNTKNKKTLIIVESPTKAKTIGQFLGKDYEVESSYGHVRDLPKSRLSIDIENNFEPHYIVPIKARKRVTQLKKEAHKAKSVILATDEDREGEAIAWHLVEALDLKEIPHQRIVFHEITNSAIDNAIKNPRDININMVDSQQARRILDRLVGYKLSPFLWEKVMKRLSAGRVQSVALRLIAEREEEIRQFKPQEYHTISAIFKFPSEHADEKKFSSETSDGNSSDPYPEISLKTNGDSTESKSGINPLNQLEAELRRINDKEIGKLEIKSKTEAENLIERIKNCNFKIAKTDKKETRKNPLPPFTTSTLQQEASKKLRYSAKQTMRIAQSLYENGNITYMRTDSLNLSKESVETAKNWIEENLGKEYASDAPRFFKTKSKLAQEAHEAIRPTNPALIPENIKAEYPQENKLYDLIWRRFIASQLPQAIFENTKIEITAQNPKNINDKFTFNSNGATLKFDGFLKIWPAKFEERELPNVNSGDSLRLREISSLEHFTEPPARYNDASLIKTLEEYGIGRPSTYAPIISVIQERNYVDKNEDRRFVPTQIGEAVNKILVANFPEIVDIQFTAKMENKFDEIADGKKQWQKVIKEFYDPFAKNLENKYQSVEKQKPFDETTNEVCEKCGKPMIIKYGRFGKFLACSGFPECKNAKKFLSEEDKKTYGKCPKCGEGEIIRKRTKKGRFFYGCSRWPKCDYASWKNPLLEQENKNG
ncbi:type I DNA topoisomerase [Patescibacteria group bacterium]|nr:type I DNA topoisomerase [Patescibacteria group bacterium]MCL5733505.1 type I DNA topoisomerase [Patescibacteria group bacterium]